MSNALGGCPEHETGGFIVVDYENSCHRDSFVQTGFAPIIGHPMKKVEQEPR